MGKKAEMQGVGIEPTQTTLTDLKTVALTTRPSLLVVGFPTRMYRGDPLSHQ
jgi:hypothetical protein